MGPPNPECVSCGCPSPATVARKVTEVSAISGRILQEIVTAHFWQDSPLLADMNYDSAVFCKECLSLVEQIDAFEQSLLKTRENFEFRRNRRRHQHNNHGRSAAKIKKEKMAEDPNTASSTAAPTMKQEPADWAAHDDFEWDLDNPNHFLDTSLQEMDGQENDDEDDDSNDEQPSRRGKARNLRSSCYQFEGPMSDYDRCQALPDRQLVCTDRAALGVDWPPDRAPYEMILRDFELDLHYLRTAMPREITDEAVSKEWDMFLLRSESDSLTFGLHGELTCAFCAKVFSKPHKRLEHILECHCGNDRQFICALCPEYDDPSEDSMFTHVADNHEVVSFSSEKSRFCPREPLLIEATQTYQCRLCTVVCRSELAYWYHWYCRHKKYRTRSCDICGASEAIASSAEHFRRHFLQTHCRYAYECFECPATFFNSVDSFKSHIKMHDPNPKSGPQTTSGRKRQQAGDRRAVAASTVAAASQRRKPQRSSTVDEWDMDLEFEEFGSNGSGEDSLSIMVKVQRNPELCLESAPELADLTTEISAEMYRDLSIGLNLLKSMPSKIDNALTSLEWDVTMLKLEFAKFTFGIPGEKKCFECNQNFENLAEKQIHCLYFHHTDPFACAICHRGFSKEASGTTHMANKHGQDSWKNEEMNVAEGYTTCDLCGLACASELAFWYHKFHSHKRYRSAQCPLCDTSCNSFILFLRHVLLKHANYKYKCFLCDKTSKSHDSFRDHLKQHAKGKIKENGSALSSSSTSSSRNATGQANAMASNDDSREDFFEQEEIEINGKKILRKKIGKKGKKPPVACEICGTVSKGAFNNARHLYTMHGIKREVQCDKCDTVCESVRAMLEHKKNNHSSASCHLCGKVFVEKGHLENHLMRHGIGKDGKHYQNERDFMCEVCSKTFTRKNYLVIHMKNHAEKTIKCTVCSKMFRWNSALQAHLSAAHGMGPKEGACTCEFCGRQFQDKSNYRQHRFTHLQVKPFNCEACGKGFIRRDLMKSHREKCHAAAAPFNLA